MNKTVLAALSILFLAFVLFQCTVSKAPAKTADANVQLKQEPLPRDANGKIIVNTNPDPSYKSPEESMRSIYVQKGYHLELVASEPMIKEPVAIAWDGNARMYVAEMRTYMQDIDGTNEDVPLSQISLLEDTDGDGKMDKSSVFIDSLLLPRMILCVGKKLLVSETYTDNLWAYADLNADGKADFKEQVYGNSIRNTANLEHQRSGFIWNLDNRIYTTTERIRYRYVNGKLVGDTMAVSQGQWGIANDDYGRMYFSTAGGENPAYGFQLNPKYGSVGVDGELHGDFIEVWPVISTPDVQGGLGRLRPDSTLNHFTGNCGPSIYRGDIMPELKGDLIIPEPVGRLIRRAKVLNKDGARVLVNAYDKEEFIASTDMNFRPVNSATGPDGCLYIVDMYRGIIQEGNWTREGSFLRPKILHKGLDKHIGRGRIYRLVPDGYKPGAKPNMLNESTKQLVKYLSSANGWWRDNAQKEIVVRQDKSVVSELMQLAIAHPDHLTRIHALWTLEGLNAIDKRILSTAFKDTSAQVRKTAIWISENFLERNDQDMIAMLSTLQTDTDADVRAQLVASLEYFANNNDLARQIINSVSEETKLAAMISKAIDAERKRRMLEQQLVSLPSQHRNLILRGKNIFDQSCAVCHGPEGRGTNGPSMPAPSFAGSARMNNKDMLIKILLHGLTGPVDGKTFPDVMAPLGAGQSNDWVASVLSYVHYTHKSKDSLLNVITAEDVKKMRELTASRNVAYTIEELTGGGSVVSQPAKPVISQKPSAPVVKSKSAEGKAFVDKSDCAACHRPESKLIGPSSTSIAAKYKATAANVEALANKIISGGSGTWGNIPMTPHPGITKAEAKKMVTYILSFKG